MAREVKKISDRKMREAYYYRPSFRFFIFSFNFHKMRLKRIEQLILTPMNIWRKGPKAYGILRSAQDEAVENYSTASICQKFGFVL